MIVVACHFILQICIRINRQSCILFKSIIEIRRRKNSVLTRMGWRHFKESRCAITFIYIYKGIDTQVLKLTKVVLSESNLTHPFLYFQLIDMQTWLYS